MFFIQCEIPQNHLFCVGGAHRSGRDIRKDEEIVEGQEPSIRDLKLQREDCQVPSQSTSDGSADLRSRPDCPHLLRHRYLQTLIKTS